MVRSLTLTEVIMSLESTFASIFFINNPNTFVSVKNSLPLSFMYF